MAPGRPPRRPLPVAKVKRPCHCHFRWPSRPGAVEHATFLGDPSHRIVGNLSCQLRLGGRLCLAGGLPCTPWGSVPYPAALFPQGNPLADLNQTALCTGTIPPHTWRGQAQIGPSAVHFYAPPTSEPASSQLSRDLPASLAPPWASVCLCTRLEGGEGRSQVPWLTAWSSVFIYYVGTLSTFLGRG